MTYLADLRRSLSVAIATPFASINGKASLKALFVQTAIMDTFELIKLLIPNAEEYTYDAENNADIHQFKDGRFTVQLRIYYLGCCTIAWDLEKSDKSLFISFWDATELPKTGLNFFGKGKKHYAGMSEELALNKYIKFRDRHRQFIVLTGDFCLFM